MSRSRQRGKGGFWTAERQREAYTALTTRANLSDAGAKALISRWKNVESPQGPTSVNRKSGAFGIGQWLGTRKPGSTDFAAQLEHVVNELNGSESVAARMLRDAKTPSQGAIGASAYERAEGYNQSTKTDNFTNATLAGMQRLTDMGGIPPAATAAPPQGLLASFFGNTSPLSMAAAADEMPQNDLPSQIAAQRAANTGIAPTGRDRFNPKDRIAGLLAPEPLSDYAAANAAGVDFAPNDQAANALSQRQNPNLFDAQASTPFNQSSIAPNLPSGLQSTGLPSAQRMAQIASLPPAKDQFGSLHVGGINAMDPPSSMGIGAQAATPGVTVGQDNPALARELDRQMMAGLPQGLTDTPVPPDPQEEAAVSATASAAEPGQQEVAGLLAKDTPRRPGSPIGPHGAMASGLAPNGGLPPLSPPQTVADLPVAEATIAPPTTFPESPPEQQPSLLDRIPSEIKNGLKGFGIAGLPGALGAVGMGLLGDKLGPGFDNALSPGERFGVGSIADAIGGPRGATATSRSNPSISYTSLGELAGQGGTGLRHSKNFGWTEVVSPDGSVRGIHYAPGQGGIFGSISNAIGGLLGSDKPSKAERDKFSGRAGLY